MTLSLSFKAAIAALAFCSFAAFAGTDLATAPASGASDVVQAASAPASAASACATCGRLDWLPNATVIGVALLFLVGAAGAMSALKRDPKWSLAAALSEKEPSAGKTQQADGSSTSMSSSSRVIAFFGMIAMLAFFVGFGTYLLWACFNGRADEASKAIDAFKSYFLCGSALYAPYALNQLKSAFK